MKTHIVVAVDRMNTIGYRGQLPWPKLKRDMENFKFLTKYGTKAYKNNNITDRVKTAVVMGRKTYNSIPAKYQPLPDRVNIVLSRNITEIAQGAMVCNNTEEVFQECVKNKVEELFVVGGTQIYGLYLYEKRVDRIYRTYVDGTYRGDTYFPRTDPKSIIEVYPSLEDNKINHYQTVYEVENYE